MRRGGGTTRTDVDYGLPLHSAGSLADEGEAEGGADDGVGRGDRQVSQGGDQQPAGRAGQNGHLAQEEFTLGAVVHLHVDHLLTHRVDHIVADQDSAQTLEDGRQDVGLDQGQHSASHRSSETFVYTLIFPHPHP